MASRPANSNGANAKGVMPFPATQGPVPCDIAS